MCCVMPPASPAATSVSRIASSSDVLPWSTWPMIVTTGGRLDEVLVVVRELGSTSSSSSARDDLDLLVELVGEDLDRVVGQRLRERRHLAEAHELLDDLRDRDAEVLGDVLDRRAGVDPDEVGALLRGPCRSPGRLGLEVAPAPATAAAAAARAALRRTAAGAARAAGAAGAATCGLGVDDDAPAAAVRRCPERSPMRESRVGRAPPWPPPPGRPGRAGRRPLPGPPGRRPRRAALRRPGPPPGRGLAARAGLLARRPGWAHDAAPPRRSRTGARRRDAAGTFGRAVAGAVGLRGDLLAGERVHRLLLVDRGGDRLHRAGRRPEAWRACPAGTCRAPWRARVRASWPSRPVYPSGWLHGALGTPVPRRAAASRARARRRCRRTPRGPARRAPGSGTARPSTRAKRRSAAWSVTRPQPMQRRFGRRQRGLRRSPVGLGAFAAAAPSSSAAGSSASGLLGDRLVDGRLVVDRRLAVRAVRRRRRRRGRRRRRSRSPRAPGGRRGRSSASRAAPRSGSGGRW